jgi:hypothetical protein
MARGITPSRGWLQTVRALSGCEWACLRWQEHWFLCCKPAHPNMLKTHTVAALCLALQQYALRPTRRDMPIIGAEHHLAPVLTLALVSRIFDVAFARHPSPAYPRGPVGRLRSHALLKTPKTRFCQSRRVQATSFAPFASAFPVTVRIGSVHHGYDRLV